MKIERDERKFDFHGIGLAIKKAREREGMTQEQDLNPMYPIPSWPNRQITAMRLQTV